VLLQQITAYVDTRDREAGGGALVLNASQSAMAEEFAKRWESMAVQHAAREARARAAAAEAADLKTTVAAAHQAALAAKRSVEQALPRDAATEAPARAPAPADAAVHGALNAYKYVGFENEFRGTREVIRERLQSYLPLLDGQGEVLDVGCGRGELLELLKARGVAARGLDVNHEMVAECRARGLDAVHGDAVGHLASLADASLGGIFAAQVVEHLEPEYLLRFLELAFHKLRPGGRIILETLNPACWIAFFESYIRDITHRWPLHPDTLKYFVLASGFTSARVEWRSPVAPHDRLQAVRVPGGADRATADLAEAFNANVEKLNARIFTHLDYAVVGAKDTG
jgi:SAM-dependent methyltransferase